MAAPLTPRDRAELAARGLCEEEAEAQLALLRSPPPAVELLRPATVGDGIVALEDADRRRLARLGLDAARDGRVGRFVPASGAATRMFAGLLAARRGEDTAESRTELAGFLRHRERFAFAEELRREAGPAWDDALREPRELLSALLDGDRLAYGERPKGLVPFHRTGAEVRTSFEEHLAEAAAHGRDAGGRVRAHFTVAPEHRGAFERRLEAVRPGLEGALGVALAVAFSEQSPSTDTLAVTPEGEPFRVGDGGLLFRPGGHGSLLANLEACAGELIVIKNIDNVLPAGRRESAVAWKAVLVGLAAELAAKVDALLAALDEDRLDDAGLAGGLRFAASALGRRELEASSSAPGGARREALRRALDRPLRVAGVVPQRGEPGGGPFWVSSDGRPSLQIVETSQVDRRAPAQAAILAAATHFNPVDLVVRVRDYRGRLYPLRKAPLVDPRTSFVAVKSHDGRPLLALERPGLWNGGMAGWNTVFVEVPGETFAPVKTVLDLLRPEHQPG